MKNKFDSVIDRYNTKSSKYTIDEEKVPADVIPMWVADMDFQTPDFVIEALKNTAEHGIFGYSFSDKSYKNAVLNWMNKRFNYFPEQEELVETPGVVFAIAHAIKAFTEPDDAIIIQPPVYYPFKMEIENNGRKVVENPLIEKNGNYTIDFKDFENKVISENVKAFVLCNPHNPVGRVFTEEELKRLADICLKHNVLIISDEIHADFIHDNRQHTMLPTLSDEVANQTILCTAPSKTFNLAGLQASNIFIKDEEKREKFKKELNKSGYHALNIMAYNATQAAYDYGEEWVEELNDYIEGNIDYVDQYLKEKIPEIKLNKPEGTYLVWLDSRGLNLNDEELKDFFLNEAKLWLDEGTMFGNEGSGFMRVNVAAPRETVEKAMDNLYNAVLSLRNKNK